MRRATRIVTATAFLLLAAYSTYTTLRIQQLQTALHRAQTEQTAQTAIGYGVLPRGPGITYAFDDAFRQYFGERGIAEVEQALRILRGPRTGPGTSSGGEVLEVLADGLRYHRSNN
jgi:hypothetical protein